MPFACQFSHKYINDFKAKKVYFSVRSLKKCQPKPSWFDSLRNCSRIKHTDDKINQLVFELYGLSEEEGGIVRRLKY